MSDLSPIELEARLAWQEHLIDELNARIAELSAELAMQQQQLRLIYQELKGLQSTSGGEKTGSLQDEIPPHY